MPEKPLGKRDQVLELLKEGKFTREQMAAKLDMSVASVSSQFTYLRWMGNFIMFDSNKIMTIATEEEYNAWTAEREANRKTPAASAKTPQEQANALTKTVATQAKQIEGWINKRAKILKDLEDMPDDVQLAEMLQEADANIVLLGIRTKRNKARLADLPEPVLPSTKTEAAEEGEVDDADNVDVDGTGSDDNDTDLM